MRKRNGRDERESGEKRGEGGGEGEEGDDERFSGGKEGKRGEGLKKIGC